MESGSAQPAWPPYFSSAPHPLAEQMRTRPRGKTISPSVPELLATWALLLNKVAVFYLQGRETMHILKRIFEIFGVNKTARGLLKIHTDEHTERIKYGYLATNPTVGPVGLSLRKECQERDVWGNVWQTVSSVCTTAVTSSQISTVCFFSFLSWKSEKKKNLVIIFSPLIFHVKYRIKSKSDQSNF